MDSNHRSRHERAGFSCGRRIAGPSAGSQKGLFFLYEVMPVSPAYRGTPNHTMRLDDPLDLFPTFIVEAGI